MDKILLPNSLTFGGGALKEITNILNTLEKSKPLIITDNTMVELDIIKPLEGYLSKFEVRYEIFKDTIPEPTSNSILSAVDIIKSGQFDKIDNPLKNAPHTHVELAANVWPHKYDRETAAYPSATLKSYKYWPPVARVDNVYGDKNLFCSCPSMDEYKETAA